MGGDWRVRVAAAPAIADAVTFPVHREGDACWRHQAAPSTLLGRGGVDDEQDCTIDDRVPLMRRQEVVDRRRSYVIDLDAMVTATVTAAAIADLPDAGAGAGAGADAVAVAVAVAVTVTVAVAVAVADVACRVTMAPGEAAKSQHGQSHCSPHVALRHDATCWLFRGRTLRLRQCAVCVAGNGLNYVWCHTRNNGSL